LPDPAVSVCSASAFGQHVVLEGVALCAVAVVPHCIDGARRRIEVFPGHPI